MRTTRWAPPAFALMLVVIATGCWWTEQPSMPVTPAAELSDTEVNILCEYNAPPPPYGKAPYYIRCENPFGLDARYGLAYKRDGFCTDNSGATPTASLRSCMSDFVSETKCRDVTPSWDLQDEEWNPNRERLYHKFNCSPMSDAELQELLASRTNG